MLHLLFLIYSIFINLILYSQINKTEINLDIGFTFILN